MSKGRAFVMCFCAILFIFSASLAAGVLSNDFSAFPAGACLTALVSITTTYIGLQVANNGVRGKFFNQALYDAENTREGKKPISGEGGDDGTKHKDAGGA